MLQASPHQVALSSASMQLIAPDRTDDNSDKVSMKLAEFSSIPVSDTVSAVLCRFKRYIQMLPSTMPLHDCGHFLWHDRGRRLLV